MQSGKLDQRVELQELDETNTGGALSQEYTPVATVAARVVFQRGDDTFEAAKVNAQAVIRVLIRYRSDVTTKWRISWQGQAYKIAAVDPSKRRDGELWLTAVVIEAT